ncbi:hypothetical protein OG21DRAFT_1511241 [Imleria badia]|nr:hypothetical protein OG21DRAFT_1511241 [Imleria badia]
MQPVTAMVCSDMIRDKSTSMVYGMLVKRGDQEERRGSSRAKSSDSRRRTIGLAIRIGRNDIANGRLAHDSALASDYWAGEYTGGGEEDKGDREETHCSKNSEGVERIRVQCWSA